MESIATIKDVAEMAGVRDATVSRAFSGKAPVAAKTRRRIMEAAASLGYRPSVAARAIRTGRTGFIGMIRSHILSCSVHEPAFDLGLDEALHERGLCLLRDTIDDQVDVAPRIVREDTVDGLLINYAFGTPPAVKQMLDRCHINAIWINRKREQNCVHPADEAAAHEATRYLLAHGHRRIAYVNRRNDRRFDRIEPHYSNHDRLAGYQRAMSEAGLPPLVEAEGASPVDAAKIRAGRGFRAMCELLDRPDRASAYLCVNQWGYAAYAAALQRGLSMPRDISLMCLDTAATDEDIAIDRMLVGYRAMGRAAVEELCELIKEPSQPRQPVVVPFEFHQAGTVACPRSP